MDVALALGPEIHRSAGTDRFLRHQWQKGAIMTTASAFNPVLRSSPGSSGLYELVDLILDEGLVIDAYVRVSLVGIELVTVDARIVVSSVDTYIRFAEAANRLDLRAKSDAAKLTDVIRDQGQLSAGIGRGMTDRAVEKVTGSGGEDNEDRSIAARMVDAVTGSDEDEKET